LKASLEGLNIRGTIDSLAVRQGNRFPPLPLSAKEAYSSAGFGLYFSKRKRNGTP
jgi:hypothetical protein